MALRCVYVDLDGTLLGFGASLFHDGEGNITTDGVKAVEACLRADVELCIFSGRRQAQVLEDARLLGQPSYIFEVGSGLVIDGEVEWLTGGLEPDETGNIFEQIEAAGVPALLLEEFDDRLEYHAPWHTNRDVSHLFRGVVDTVEIDVFLDDERPRSSAPDRQRPHPPQVRETQVRPAERLPPDPERRGQGPGRRAPHADPRLRAR